MLPVRVGTVRPRRPLNFKDLPEEKVPRLSVIQEVDLTLREEAAEAKVKVYAKTHSVLWNLCADQARAGVVLEANCQESCHYASVAFFERDSGFRMKRMTPFKTIQLTEWKHICWVEHAVEWEAAHTVGARIRLMAVMEEPILNHLTVADVAFVVADVEFPAHKAYLSAISPVFNRMFNGDFREKNTKEVELKDVEPDHVCSFLAFLYHQPNVIHDDNVMGLLALADRYEVANLSNHCLSYIRHCSNISLMDKFIMAEQYDAEDLQRYLLDSMTAQDARNLAKDPKAHELSGFTLRFLEKIGS